MKVTIKDIAEKAGVSATSVSLVLNGRPFRISEETRDRILKSAEELGYKQKARQTLADPGEERIIGLLQPDLDNIFINQCVAGMEKYASAYGWKLLICNTEDTTARSLEYLELLAKLGAKGVIAIPPKDMDLQDNSLKLVQFFRRTAMKTIFFDRQIKDLSSDFISADNRQGAFIATEHLILNGHNNIGLLAGPREIYYSRNQVIGYKDALNCHKISFAAENVYYGDFHFQAGYDGAAYFNEKGIHAIFACNDEMAMGIYQFAADNGLHIGEDISVVGYDNIPICEKLSPPLTSVHLSGGLLGRRACEMLINRIDRSRHDEIHNTYFAPQLVERRSVKSSIK